MKDFIDQHFDKLLLFFAFLVVFHWGVHAKADEVQHEIFSFAHEFQGALLGLITGIAVGKKLAVPAREPSDPPAAPKA